MHGMAEKIIKDNKCTPKIRTTVSTTAIEAKYKDMDICLFCG